MNPFRMSAAGQGQEPALAPPLAPAGPRRIHQGTEQQEALWAELVGGERHCMVEARAGSGKSASCREGMHRQLELRPGLRVRYAVYNNSAAEEFRGSCPAEVEVGTIHSFGYAALKKHFRSQLEKNKTYLLLDETREGKQLPRYMRKSVAMLVGQAKNQFPTAQVSPQRLLELLTHYDINDYGRPHVITGLASEVLARSAEWVQVVDFDDMIWLPLVHGCGFPAVDVLYIDEAQDWNRVQRGLVPQVAGGGRVVAVGDPHQAIYIWRGADPESMPRLREFLAGSDQGLCDFPLTVTFRCPASHVELARGLVPDIRAREGAPPGTVAHEQADRAVALLQPGDLVICPTNAPVIQAALRLIAQRRPACVKGRAVGDQLLGLVRGCGECRTVAELSRAVESWKARELARLADLDGVEDLVDSVQDRAAGLQAVLSCCAQPSEVEPAIDQLFRADFARDGSAVNFSTIHRAKGAEADRVWLLDVPTRPPEQDWEVEQARNLRYVALTRSKDVLTFVKP